MAGPSEREVRILPDAAAIARRGAELFVQAAKDAVKKSDAFTVALAGGSTPKTLYSLLADDPDLRAQLPWEKIHFFFGDERHVPPDHPSSNFRMANESLFSRALVRASRITRIKGEYADAEKAALEYEQTLRGYFTIEEGGLPRFDLVLLGMGDEGHTLSLFPGTKALHAPPAESLLGFSTPKISKSHLNLPGPDFVDRVYALTDRNNRVLVNLQRMFGHGRLAGTGYMSILPVDQGIEHSGGASFAKNPDYFDAENIVKLAIEGGCNAVASTFGVLGAVSRKYAHKIPFLVKINHNELLTLSQQVRPDDVRHRQASRGHGRAAVGATIYFGSDPEHAADRRGQPGLRHGARTGMATVLWCYLRNSAFKTKEEGLSRGRRSHRTGQSPGRDDRGRHHQAEAAGEQRRIQGAEHRRRATASTTSACTPT
jgi:6-phosphogluconolactonase